ncbi:MAG: PorV/PorQ family protein [Candidatus Eisenbacteria bacterium]|nr:PorV/PorQ family protein [Candidatus Eisenbacteria bacterium]
MTRSFGLPALILVATMLMASVAWAGDGTAGSTFQDPFWIGVGAGPSAMAAYTAAPGDLWSLTYNPAGLAGVDRLKLGVSQIEWAEDTSFSYLGMGLPRGEGGLAMGLAYFDLGSVPVTDMYGTDLDESAEAYNFGFVGGYGFQVPNICNLKAGLSGHVIQASLDEETGTAIGLNMGLLYGLMENQVQLGVAARNLGTKIKIDEEEDEQNLTFAGGVSYSTMKDQIPNVDLMIGADALLPKDQDVMFGVGGEIWLYQTLALRAGYQSGSEFGNLSYGAGFRYSDFQLDYTYADYEDWEATHRISLTMAFGD